MRSVWKFPIKEPETFELNLPVGAKVIHVDVQHEQPCMWVDVETTAPLELRRFIVHGTGHEVVPGARHVGSFMVHDGAFVFHLFEAAP